MSGNSYTNRSFGIKLKPIDLFAVIASGATGFLFLLLNAVPSNTVLAILPFVYGIGYLFLLSQALRLMRSKTAILFAACEFLRMVVLVLITGITNQYGFNAFQTDSFSLLAMATLLIAYEFVVGSLVIYLYSLIHSRDTIQNTEKSTDILSLSNGEKIGIVIIIASAIVIGIAIPEVRRQINFFVLDAAKDKIRATVAGSTSGMLTLIMNFVHYAFLCVFIIVLSWAYRKYSRRGKYFYYFISIVIGLISIATIFGESRASLVYTAFAVFACTSQLFPKYRKKTMILVAAGLTIVLVGMTVYRLFVVYRYTNYADAIAAGPRVKDNYYVGFVESYLLGPQSVAAGIQLGRTHSSEFTLATLVFDILRPCMGFNLLLKNSSLQTSITMYNTMLYGAERSNGVFLQISAQGYCYFGYVFAPIFLVAFLLLAFKFEQWIAKTKSLFVFFFLNYIHVRLATVVLGGTMSGFITTTSMLLLIMGFFWIVQRITKDSIEKRIG